MQRFLSLLVSAAVAGVFSYFCLQGEPLKLTGDLLYWLTGTGVVLALLINLSEFLASTSRTNYGDTGWKRVVNLGFGAAYTVVFALIMLRHTWEPLFYVFYLGGAAFLGELVVGVLRRVFCSPVPAAPAAAPEKKDGGEAG